MRGLTDWKGGLKKEGVMLMLVLEKVDWLNGCRNLKGNGLKEVELFLGKCEFWVWWEIE
ncbi:hypothetical protein [Bacillus pumilus]|uniref:hypothetical protein n=1 Tax=Bacillus pumilus TaxID=1408 RepID=UPI001642AE76|nr:hypothetical protein [Bacillus pumilus]